MSDTRDRYSVSSTEWWIHGAGLRRAGEDELRGLECLCDTGELDAGESERHRTEDRRDAVIREKLVEHFSSTPVIFCGIELPSFVQRLEERRAAREFVDSQMELWLAAAEVYLRDAPTGECCGQTGEFILGRSDAPGSFEGCARCRSMLVAHEVAWEVSLRALPVGVSQAETVSPVPLDDNGVDLPRALLRLALEADNAAAVFGDTEVRPRIPITSGIGSLWDWVASLAPEELAPGLFTQAPPIVLGPVLGVVSITKVVSAKVMEVSMPSRPKRKALKRQELTRALTEYRRRAAKPTPA